MDILPSVVKSKKSNHKIIKRECKDIICPYCITKLVYKNGRTKEGRQKYICRECKKSFSNSNNSIVDGSKKT